MQPGTCLGPYQIQCAIDAGGRGDVYKARDTRLDRTVAIKILPAQVTADPDLRERLERGARAVAALDHPHICTLHDVGHQAGIDFFVMEYLEGQTLAERLENGALPLDPRWVVDSSVCSRQATRPRRAARYPSELFLCGEGTRSERNELSVE
jgi:eukaryotic-like serine/threonine-protein kinase